MHEETITFQLATHFLPKIALQLECLCKTVNQACEETHPVIHHYALKNIIEIIKLIEKPELKSRFLKELIRIEHVSNKTNTTLDKESYQQLHSQIQLLSHKAGIFGEKIHQDSFLQSIRQTQAFSYQECEMHSPQLLLWLESDSAQRQQDLAIWLHYLHPLYLTVNIYLLLLRNSVQFEEINTRNGFYQCQLPPKTSCHLIMLRMAKSFGIVPKIQLGHHGLSLRLCEASSMREIKETKAPLGLGICVI